MKRFIVAVFALILFAAMAARAAETNPSPQPDSPVAITIDAATVTNDQITGLGWNVGPLWIPDSAEAPADLQKFFGLLRYTRQSFIRLMFQYYEWEGRTIDGEFVPENDDDDPWTPPEELFSDFDSGFAWKTEQGLNANLIAVLDFCEANGIDVEINNWEANLKSWLRTEQYADPEFYKTPIPYKDYLRDAEEFGENVAALVYYLKTQANGGHGYDCVKYYAIWNEPAGGHTDYTLVHVDYPGCLNLLHKTVRQHLEFYDKEMGTDVLGDLDCIGMEAYPFWRNSPAAGHKHEDWDHLLGRGVLQYLEKPDGLPGEITCWPSGDPYMDSISVHNYWAVFDYDEQNPNEHNHGTIGDSIIDEWVRGSIKQIRDFDIDGQIEPLYINELGCFPYIDTTGDRTLEGSIPSYDQSLLIAETAIRAFAEEGFAGISRWGWNMHTTFAAASYPGCWWETEPKGRVKALDANYYPYTLLTRHIPKGSAALATTVEGGADASKGPETWRIIETRRVFATAFRAPSNRLQLFVVNDSYEAKTCRVTLEGFKARGKTKLRHLYVTQEKHDRIYEADAMKPTGAQPAFTVTVAPRSINVFTQGTPYDNDSPPWEFLK